MGDSRLHRLEQALDKAITSALASSCNEEAFLSFFSECDGEDSRRKLLNLRELFVQLLVASVEHELSVVVKTSNLHKKLPILDAATGGKCPLYPTANPQSVAAGLTIKYKREALSRLEDLKTKQLANLDATEQRYHAAVKKVTAAVQLLEKKGEENTPIDKSIDLRVHHNKILSTMR